MKKTLIVLLAVLMIAGLAFAGSQQEQGSKEASLTVLLDSTDGWVRNFNPFSNAKQFTLGFMHEYLVLFDPLNKNKEIPWLAEEVISEPDLKTLTIKVRKGVKWSDGTPLTAEDVAYSFTISKDHPAMDNGGFWGEDGKCKAVRVIDDYTVQIEMREPNRFWRQDVLNEHVIIPKHVWENVEDPMSYVYENPVVTGPFSEIIEFTPELIVLGRNPYYWKADELKVDRLVVPQFNGNEGALALLESGKVDWAYIFIPDIDNTYVKGDSNRNYWYGKNDAVRISLNYQTPDENNRKAFNNVAFRRAFSLSIDRQGIIDTAAYGYLDSMVPPVTGLPPALLGYENPKAREILDKYAKFDPEMAKKILDEAGFKDADGDGWRDNPDGTPIKFDILSPAGWTDWNDGAVIVAQGLRNIGINANAKAPDLGVIIEKWDSGEFDALYSGYGKSSNIWKFYYDTIGDASRAFTPTWWSVCQNNYINEEINSLIAKMPTAKTEEELRQYTDKVELFFAENMINIPLFYNGLWHIYNTSRFTGWSTKDNPVCEPALFDHDIKIYHLLQLRPVK
ncbi:ABC transporter substrate-binding protein [Spirochaetia bacterium 38H-sp]|uniref:ABC transporter substrate-binding protein n=1 Tax=Rarispira pelagica TaxID=3141764 RepID=A0ABU9U952_9SPIR